MHVVIAPDCFTGTLTATQAAGAIAAGWSQSAPRDILTLVPLSDGGPGFLDVMVRAVEGEVIATTVADPLGREVPASILVADQAGVRTAYLESAQACTGLPLKVANSAVRFSSNAAEWAGKPNASLPRVSPMRVRPARLTSL